MYRYLLPDRGRGRHLSDTWVTFNSVYVYRGPPSGRQSWRQASFYHTCFTLQLCVCTRAPCISLATSGTTAATTPASVWKRSQASTAVPPSECDTVALFTNTQLSCRPAAVTSSLLAPCTQVFYGICKKQVFLIAVAVTGKKAVYLIRSWIWKSCQPRRFF